MSGPLPLNIQPTRLSDSLWFRRLAMATATGFAFVLYLLTAAPGLTWAHFGADGGELLAAAVTNGVPHPPGYPLYMLLLQGWLWLTGLLLPTTDVAWRGNLLSVVCAACSVGVTVRVAAYFLRDVEHRWLWAALVGVAWCVAPLPWSQALITEVYALHMLFVALLGWALFVKRGQRYWLMIVVALGCAHHLTFVLLLPAVLYTCWCLHRKSDGATAPYRFWRDVALLALAGLLAALFHLRTLWVASAAVPAPINWGYPDNWGGFWWLVSGQAYRSYLFGAPSSTLLVRVAAWASTLTNQLTPLGLAVMLVGLAHWDRQRPELRNFSLLWLIPLSVYAINYYTRDSEIYLLPVVWLTMLWFGVGLATLVRWLQEEWPQWRQQWVNRHTAQKSRVTSEDVRGADPMGNGYFGPSVALLTLIFLMGLVGWRWSTISARTDMRATEFLLGTMAVLEPHSMIISSADAETFALWYGAWGSGELLKRYPDTVLINYALYQFPWYRRLLAAQYPDVVDDSSSVEEIMARNADRPIFFSEKLAFWPEEQMEAVGPIWRYVGP